MDTARFTKTAPGRLVPIRLRGQALMAFVPNDLSPAVPEQGLVLDALARAARALGYLAGQIASTPAAPTTAALFAVREVVFSSRIEGVDVEPCAVVAAYGLDGRTRARLRLPPAADEVVRALRGQALGLALARQRRISRAALRRVHAVLFDAPSGASKGRGRFRAIQNWVGRAGLGPETANYVPPPVPEMRLGLAALERFMQRAEAEPLISVALTHYQFEALHPFIDGNGRVGRILNLMSLARRGVLPAPLISPSASFWEHRDGYFEQLLAVSQTGAWAPWIRYMLARLTEAATDASTRLGRVLDLRAAWAEQLERDTRSRKSVAIVDLVLRQPVLTRAIVERELGLSRRAAMQQLARMARLNIIQRMELAGQEQVFACEPVLALMG